MSFKEYTLEKDKKYKGKTRAHTVAVPRRAERDEMSQEGQRGKELFFYDSPETYAQKRTTQRKGKTAAQSVALPRTEK